MTDQSQIQKTGPSNSNMTPGFREELDGIINDMNNPDADADFTPYVFESTYVNMEFVIPRYGDGPDFAKVTMRLRDKDGLPIGRSNNNPILDTRMYEVEYKDGQKNCWRPMQ